MSASKLRSAEEIAREMVPEPIEQSGSWFVVVRDGEREITLASWRKWSEVEEDRDDARAIIAGLIEQSRAEGAGSSEAELGEVVASHVEAIDHYREGLHRIWRGAENPRRVAADYLGEDPPPEQPRDLAGRIRALVQQKAGEWADAHGDERAILHDVMMAIRAALADVRRGCGVAECIAWMCSNQVQLDRRERFRQAADELEQIVRECEEKR